MSVWKEYFVYSASFPSLSSGGSTPGQIFTTYETRIDPDSDFEFAKTAFMPVHGRARIQYRDDTSGRFLMKGSPDLRTIGGTSLYTMAPADISLAPGFLPFIWPIPYIIPAAATLTVSASNLLGVTYNLQIAFHGSKIRPGVAPWDRNFRARMPYVYSLSSSGTVSVPANGSTTVSIATDIDSHFLIHKITGVRAGQCLVTFKDSRDRQWTDQPLQFDNIVGNGHFPNILSSPRFIARGSVITVTIQDISGSANVVELDFVGVKLFE